MTKLATVAGLCVLIVVAGGAAVYFGRAAMDQTTTLEISTVTATATTTVTNDSAITDYSVCFSPGGGCAAKLIDIIGNATTSINIMIYEFSNTNIANALVAAQARGVDVKVIMDGSEAATDNIGVVDLLNSSKVPLKVYTPLNGILHDKVAIIDNQTVVTGSYNWSYSADNYNDENMLVLHSGPLALQYEAEFKLLWSATSTIPNGPLQGG